MTLGRSSRELSPDVFDVLAGVNTRTFKEERTMGKNLMGTKSHENLKNAFAGESQANRRYLYFARMADIEGKV